MFSLYDKKENYKVFIETKMKQKSASILYHFHALRVKKKFVCK